MQLLWGDLHNHCGITYGFGSLENALARAEAHLDFCAVIGHAMWPDMYAREPETEFIVDFHRKGFQKLQDHWQEVRATVAAANTDDFVTFQGYEMHSGKYGDHHLISPDDSLPLIYRDSPAELVSDAGVDAMSIVHHIGYTPGYRGIDWDLFDAGVTPLVEVYSKHGCAMRETAPFPYYHDMGPRDSRNTVEEGLRRGYHFGLVGSTDHHAGYPGSYGDGKLAVLASEKTRAGIWEALQNRRTYAVTGDRIDCEFYMDDWQMGSIVPAGGGHTLRGNVKGGYAIDKVVLYKNGKPVSFVAGETLPAAPKKGRYKVRVEMGWGNSTEDFRWDGRLAVKGGRIVGVEPCFRGKSVLSPTGDPEDKSGEINGMDNRILSVAESEAAWQCFTVRNVSTLHPQTSAVIVEIDGAPDTGVTVSLNGIEDSRTLKELCDYGYTHHVRPYHSQAFKVHSAVFETAYSTELEWRDLEAAAGDYYHMEVAQKNGCLAFVSPVFLV